MKFKKEKAPQSEGITMSITDMRKVLSDIERLNRNTLYPRRVQVLDSLYIRTTPADCSREQRINALMEELVGLMMADDIERTVNEVVTETLANTKSALRGKR